jgi:hypothetical protein
MEERIEKLEKLLGQMAEQFVLLITNNNLLLAENIRLMKEGGVLRKK